MLDLVLELAKTMFSARISSFALNTPLDSWFTAAIVGACLLGFGYYAGKKAGLSSLKRELNLLLAHAKTESAKTLEILTASNTKLAQKLENCMLMPRNHAVVPFDEENVSYYRTADGYRMQVEVKLEHRAVAEKVLCRELAANEVVHHIYAPAKDDNSIGNLCVMDRDQHDLFHTFLTREFKLKNRYPSVAEQKRLLSSFYQGILLEEAIRKKTVSFAPIASAIQRTRTTNY